MAELRDYWSDKMAITWDIEDVHSIHDGLTDEQAISVLDAVLHDHDAEYGVNWDSLRAEAERQFEEDEDDDTDGMTQEELAAATS